MCEIGTKEEWLRTLFDVYFTDVYFSSDVSIVTYQVVCKNSSCHAETLKAPSKATLDETLGHAGKTLHVRSKPVDDDDDDEQVLMISFH